jgi:hypothetical protein
MDRYSYPVQNFKLTHHPVINSIPHSLCTVFSLKFLQ